MKEKSFYLEGKKRITAINILKFKQGKRIAS
jgi:hypothetical protein